MTAFYYRFRGCSWDNYVRSCRLADRSNHVPDGRTFILGFRIFQEYE
jgi:formylglycine-generating enzyme required for sulfatase activity